MRCPICRRSVDSSPANKFRPFCSERCQLVDLGTWAGEEYRIEGQTRHDDRGHPDDLKRERLIPNDPKKNRLLH
ncbi:MAG: DNA gyrase inhibitor YacG [Candidatus Binataceae bacterium]|nr:DNA gyrase inhibitor YacG [Candidatus Binataceae bacterium]